MGWKRIAVRQVDAPAGARIYEIDGAQATIVAPEAPAIAAVRARRPLVGASLAGFAPADPAAAVDDLGTILRIVGALA